MAEGYIVYKVVRNMGEYRRGNLVSCYSPTNLQVEYQIGVKAIPKIGKLFCFESLEHARWFIKKMILSKNFVILLCETNSVVSSIGVSKIPQGSSREEYAYSYDNFWKSPFIWIESHNGTEIPSGTVFCDYVIPLEVIQ